MDRLKFILTLAGFGCFIFAFILSGVYPYMITDARQSEVSIADLAKNVTPEFRDLQARYPEEFQRAFGKPKTEGEWVSVHAEALQLGRDIYVGEACWHCHSQYVRPVANEDVRFGRVLTSADDNHALQRPVLWGTRRVGPDLTHEGGKRSNDWHVAHLKDPQSTSPGSVMPRYTWFFDKGFQVHRRIDPDLARRQELSPETSYEYPGLYLTQAEADEGLAAHKAALPANIADQAERLFVKEGYGPNKRGLAVIAYLQFLGTYVAPTAKDGEE